MKIVLASDHGGYNLKEEMKKHLIESGYEVEDFGTHSLDSVNYPDYGKKVGMAIAKGEFEKGILFCGTGIGISLAANKVKGIRAAVVSDVFSARMSRAHNNANILSLGERVVGKGLATEIIDAWLATEFEGGRHEARVSLITDIENECL